MFNNYNTETLCQVNVFPTHYYPPKKVAVIQHLVWVLRLLSLKDLRQDSW